MMNLRSLSKKSDFHEVYERGTKKVGRLLVVYLLDGPDHAGAVVASRKVGNAIRRNRAKRLLREAVRNGVLGQPAGREAVLARFFPEPGQAQPAADRAVGLWVVLVARSAMLEFGAEDVRAELDQLLETP